MYVSAAPQTTEAPPAGLLEVVERMFDRCFAAGEFKQAAGIAMEAHRLDVLERAIQTSNDPNTMLEYSFEVVMTLTTNRAFRNSVLTLLARLYSEMPEPDYLKMCQWCVETVPCPCTYTWPRFSIQCQQLSRLVAHMHAVIAMSFLQLHIP